MNRLVQAIHSILGVGRVAEDLANLGTIVRLMKSVYEAAGGDDGLLALAASWHERVIADDIVGHAFERGFRPDHTERLAAYWAEALGGPSRYSAEMGDESAVVRLHSGNQGPHDEMDDRAIVLFGDALDAVGLTDPVRQVLFNYFATMTKGPLAAYQRSADDVPDGLSIPHWSWDGEVT